MKPGAAVLSAVTVGLLALAGCVGPTGDDHMDDGHHDDGGHHNDSDGGAGNLPLTGAEDHVANVTAGEPTEFRFTPDRIEVLAGVRVGIVLENVGDAAHEFSIEAVAFHLHAQSGATESGAFIAPEPGQYVIGCYIQGHFEAGMEGTLVVL